MITPDARPLEHATLSVLRESGPITHHQLAEALRERGFSFSPGRPSLRLTLETLWREGWVENGAVIRSTDGWRTATVWHLAQGVRLDKNRVWKKGR